jgi:hypothetical protein
MSFKVFHYRKRNTKIREGREALSEKPKTEACWLIDVTILS